MQHLLFSLLTVTVLIKSWVKRVEVLGIQSILYVPQGFAETLEVDDLAFTQEADRIADFRILDQTKDVVVGGAGLLFSGHIFMQICDHIALALEEVCDEWFASSGLWP